MIEWYINSGLEQFIPASVLLAVIVCAVVVFGGLRFFFWALTATTNDPQAGAIEAIKQNDWTKPSRE